MVKITDKQQFD